MADDADTADTIEDVAESGSATQTRHRPTNLGTAFGLIMCVAMGSLVGWLGVRAHQSHQQERERALMVQIARQGAVNLTTIDYNRADADVQRILDSATGTFYDDFSKQSQPFIDVVKQAQSKSEGTVAEAGLESEQGGTAHVLVAVSVKTSNAGVPEQQPREWRMRVSVQQLGENAKVSNVEFVA